MGDLFFWVFYGGILLAMFLIAHALMKHTTVMYNQLEAMTKGDPVAANRFMMSMELVNQIDDYLEYRYKGHSAEEIRNYVLELIEEYAERISKT